MKAWLVFLVAVLLSGCRLTIDLHVDVDADAGGTLAVSVTADGELEDAARQAGVDPLARLVERVEALDAGWAVDQQVDAATGAHQVSLRRRFAAGEFDVVYGGLRQALDAPEARLLGPLDIALDEEADLISVQGALPLELSDVAAADLGTDVASLTSQLDGVVESSVTVTTPGPPVDGAVDGALVAVDGQPATPPYPDAPATLTWRAAPGTVTQVAATFERGGTALLGVLLYAGGGVLAVLLIGGGVWAQRRR